MIRGTQLRLTDAQILALATSSAFDAVAGDMMRVPLHPGYDEAAQIEALRGAAKYLRAQAQNLRAQLAQELKECEEDANE